MQKLPRFFDSTAVMAVLQTAFCLLNVSRVGLQQCVIPRCLQHKRGVLKKARSMSDSVETVPRGHHRRFCRDVIVASTPKTCWTGAWRFARCSKGGCRMTRNPTSRQIPHGGIVCESRQSTLPSDSLLLLHGIHRSARKCVAWGKCVATHLPIVASQYSIPLPRLQRDGKLTVFGSAVVGALSRSTAQIAVQPVLNLKVLLQGRGTWPGWAVFFGNPELWWKGTGAQMLFAFPHGALNFAALMASRGFLRRVVESFIYKRNGAEGRSQAAVSSCLTDFASQAIATLISSVVSTPQMVICDRISAGLHKDFRDAVMYLWTAGGIREFYVGWSAGMLQKIPSYGLTWVTYQRIRALHRWLTRESAPATTENLTFGTIASAAVVILLMPLDTVKTRLVTQPLRQNLSTLPRVPPYGTEGAGCHYSGLQHCFFAMLREEGITSFYRALPLRLLSVVPMMAVQFTSFELLKQRVQDFALNRQRSRMRSCVPRTGESYHQFSRPSGNRSFGFRQKLLSILNSGTTKCRGPSPVLETCSAEGSS